MIRDGLCYRLASEMYINDCSLAQACYTYGIETDYLSDAEIYFIYDLVEDFKWDWP